MRNNIILAISTILLVINLIIGGMIMADTSYAYCGSKCKHPVYVKEDYAVLTGEIETTETDNLTSIKVDYPEGFNKDNTVPISFGVGGARYASGYAGYNYGVTPTTGQLGHLNGTLGRSVSLNDDSISVGVYRDFGTSGTSITYYYKLVLMKIGE